MRTLCRVGLFLAAMRTLLQWAGAGRLVLVPLPGCGLRCRQSTVRELRGSCVCRNGLWWLCAHAERVLGPWVERDLVWRIDCFLETLCRDCEEGLWRNPAATNSTRPATRVTGIHLQTPNDLVCSFWRPCVGRLVGRGRCPWPARLRHAQPDPHAPTAAVTHLTHTEAGAAEQRARRHIPSRMSSPLGARKRYNLTWRQRAAGVALAFVTLIHVPLFRCGQGSWLRGRQRPARDCWLIGRPQLPITSMPPQPALRQQICKSLKHVLVSGCTAVRCRCPRVRPRNAACSLLSLTTPMAGCPFARATAWRCTTAMTRCDLCASALCKSPPSASC